MPFSGFCIIVYPIRVAGLHPLLAQETRAVSQPNTGKEVMANIQKRFAQVVTATPYTNTL